MIEHNRILNAAASSCARRLFDRGIYGNDVPVRCSPVRWPKDCAAEYEQLYCFGERMGKQINQCDTEVYALENAKKAADSVTDTVLKKAGLEDLNKMRKKLDEVNELRGLISKASDPRLSPGERLDVNRDLAQKLNAYGNTNGLSKKLTDDALSRTTDINKSALGELDKALRVLAEEHQKKHRDSQSTIFVPAARHFMARQSFRESILFVARRHDGTNGTKRAIGRTNSSGGHFRSTRQSGRRNGSEDRRLQVRFCR